MTAGQSEGASPEPFSRLNASRVQRGVQPVQQNESLDRLAATYLDELLLHRELSPAGYGSVDQRDLSQEIAAAIGENGFFYRYVGVVVAYGQSFEHAMNVAVGTEANGPALFEPAYTEAGLAAAEIPAGDAWFAPPPGGVGRNIEMTGMTVTVIVTTGAYRATGS